MNRYAVYTYQWQLTPFVSLSQARWELERWKRRGYANLRIVGLWPRHCAHCGVMCEECVTRSLSCDVGSVESRKASLVSKASHVALHPTRL